MNEVRFKGIRHNVLNDAPFIGAILIAKSCSKGCCGCINEHLKSDDFEVVMSVESIISEVKSNKLNSGIILSGLEWTEQAEDIMPLVDCAINENLEVMIYTHLSEMDFLKLLPQIINYPIYIKFGAYLPDFASDVHFSHGIQLATKNQYIKYFGR